MREGVECEVELVHDSRGVVIRVISKTDEAEDCVTIIKYLIQCVMEAKADFCHTVKPEFFLLNSTSEADYLNPDNLFSMSEVNKALISDKKKFIFSSEGKGEMKRSKVLWLHKLTFWENLFPIAIEDVYHYLKNIVSETYDLGMYLDLPYHVLQAIQVDFPTDVKRRKTELVKGWMNNSLAPPCWYTLVSALRKIDRPKMAEEIEKEHSEFSIVKIIYESL